MTKIAICPGSFDPPTEGHINIVKRGLELFDTVIVAVAVNSSKKGLFSLSERVELLEDIFKGQKRIKVDTFENQLLVDYARSKKAKVLLRGLRTIQDYDYEFQMALANKRLAADIETIFMMTDSNFSYVSSSLIREILSLGGNTQGLVPKIVEKKFKEKMKNL